MKKQILLVLVWFCCYMTDAQELNIYPVPNELIYSKHNDDFTVCVRLPGGDWEDLFEHRVMVDLDNPQPSTMVQFDFSGRVEMRVKVNNGMIHRVKIRPLATGIAHTVQENRIFFTLDRPGKFSLEVNGDRLHNLHIFANAMDTDIPSPDDPDVIWFGPGVHRPKDLPGDVFSIPSNKTVYLAPGAVVRGRFVCNRVENVRFRGRGYIEEPMRGFELTYCKNIEIDGLTVINPSHYTVYGGEVDGLTIRNLKSFSCKGWSDGIDLMSCSNVDIEDIFMRNSDDCIAIYTHRWNFYGDARNYRVKNAILWADVAHPINIGLHGNAEGEGEVIENLHFSDIDILEHDEDDRNYQGCIAFSVSDRNLVQNVTFENIRVESIQEGQLINMRVLYNQKYSFAPGRGIHNVTFRNVRYDGMGENPSIIEGYSEECDIRDITFENLVIRGKRIKSLRDADIRIGQFAQGIRVK